MKMAFRAETIKCLESGLCDDSVEPVIDKHLLTRQIVKWERRNESEEEEKYEERP